MALLLAVIFQKMGIYGTWLVSTIETSPDGIVFHQMRTFHLDKGDGEISFGIYAASSVDHSFTAQFSEMEVGECKWQSWSAEETGFKQTANK